MGIVSLPKLRRMQLVLRISILYGLFGFACVLVTFWQPLPDYKILQALTSGVHLTWVVMSGGLWMQLLVLPNPGSLSVWKNIWAYLMPWGLIFFVLFAACLVALLLVPPVIAIGQQEYQVDELRIAGLFPLVLTVGIAPEMYRRLSNARHLSNT